MSAERASSTSSINLGVLIWLTTPPNLQYVATLPCNMSLTACFADINVSHGSVATYARCGGIFDIHLTASLPRNLPVKTFLNRLRIDRIMVMSLGPVFLPALYFVRVSCFSYYSAALTIVACCQN